MTAIAGIARPGKRKDVEKMLDCLSHRGQKRKEISEINGTTFGVASTQVQTHPVIQTKDTIRLFDYVGWSHYARVDVKPNWISLERDPLGLAPLYYSWTQGGALCFASEVKALLPLTQTVYLLSPGSIFDGRQTIPYFHLERKPELQDPPELIARELRAKLEAATRRCIGPCEVGAWLSGGLDSSTIAALARPYIDTLHTFAAGLPGAPDLTYAREAAAFLHSEHHEVVVRFEDMLAVLPEVIYYLESFDPLLVRSSITNFLAAKRAAEFVPAVFSGEGGDELFGGYEYLKSIPPGRLADELIDITKRLHNTALQRVDRSASAHGTIAHIVFLDPDVVDYALQIPVRYKIHAGIEKWILRQAMQGCLPQSVLNRKKAKFWDGAGVGELFSRYANEVIRDTDFNAEKLLPNGWHLNSKEELFYYRIFKEHFGALTELSWMGRTNGFTD